MKKLIETTEGDGMETLLGQVVTLLCSNYFYTGELVGVDDAMVMIKNPKIIYETGSWDKAEWEDAQALPTEILCVYIASIESFGAMK